MKTHPFYFGWNPPITTGLPAGQLVIHKHTTLLAWQHSDLAVHILLERAPHEFDVILPTGGREREIRMAAQYSAVSVHRR